MIMANKVYALIFAGGMGSRMGNSKLPKQFLELGGRPIIDHTVQHFEQHPDVDQVVIVCVDSWIDYLKEYLKKNHYTKIMSVVPGGKTGQESIFCGLKEIFQDSERAEDAVVLIHDGVRPLIDAETIKDCIESVVKKGCTATVSSSPETVIEVIDGEATKVLDRSVCKFARAPQGFVFSDIYQAHLEAQEDGFYDFTDSVSLMAHYGYPIYTVEGPMDNIKITSRKDFFAFKGYMDYKEMGQLW